MVSSLSSERPLCCPRRIRRFISSSSGTKSSIMAATLCSRSASIFFSASACGMVRGNPSKMTPLCSLPKLSYTPARMSTISSSGMSWPLSMYPLAVFPSSVPFLISLRSTSPVEICPSPYFSISLSLWVPFPAPGAPKITIFFIILSLKYKCLSNCGLPDHSRARSPR